MIDALYTATAGLKSQQTQIDTLSNNVSNMQTPGFKAQRVAFGDVAVISPGQVQAGLLPERSGAGSEIIATNSLFSQGQMVQTNNTWDIGIQGDGFLEVVDGGGNHLYTRSGQLHVDSEGYLVTSGGNRLAQDIQVPPDATNIQINQNGQIYANVGGAKDATLLGSFELATFPSPTGLQSVGGNNYAATQASGDASIGRPSENGVGSIMQGSLEGSNVDMVSEMATLVVAQRAYQLNARVLQASDQILDTINNLRQ
ncbi:flagellar hook-basal body protein [Dyella kyungheensis]|jgi:flagellar basal-body rod protein FlgG|uniref:Flagellar hook-basal body complex protein n=1 Tax=Dyella kyungheensis TaxID=1242174 RepID=A0ABS2JPH7_9GAMM|nr:flagellar hook-basal body complex protein [Dyella kyungheensis]MBM7120915.1 flagellar hook-basal body complex protein [Dyella kyungheensis]